MSRSRLQASKQQQAALQAQQAAQLGARKLKDSGLMEVLQFTKYFHLVPSQVCCCPYFSAQQLCCDLVAGAAGTALLKKLRQNVDAAGPHGSANTCSMPQRNAATQSAEQIFTCDGRLKCNDC